MREAITDGVSVKVKSTYQIEASKPDQNLFVFSYTVWIENQNDFNVKLLRRFWRITDAFGNYKEVEGDGVIGQQPIIVPGSQHEYNSWCPLPTNIGTMEGYYIMQRDLEGSRFKVYIPKFILTEDAILN